MAKSSKGLALFVLPSRGRPHNLRRLIVAWWATKATLPVLLRLDDDDPALQGYLSLPLPPSWEREIGPRLPLSSLYNDAFQRAPERPYYGFIADDVVPETQRWDQRLVEVAGLDGMAVPAGGHDPDGAPHFVLGGDLVRSLDWLALPGLDRLFIDKIWQDIAEARGVLRRVPEVVLAHKHFSNSGAIYDSVYKKTNKVQDRALYNAFSDAFSEV